MKDYTPYTEEEFKELKSVIDNITTHIPNDRMQFIWNNHNKINKTNIPTPCSCGSAAANWIRATETIRGFVRDKAALLLPND